MKFKFRDVLLDDLRVDFRKEEIPSPGICPQCTFGDTGGGEWRVERRFDLAILKQQLQQLLA